MLNFKDDCPRMYTVNCMLKIPQCIFIFVHLHQGFEYWVKRVKERLHRYGDVHYYNYKDDCLDPSKYPRAKFVSEYGYQSAPSFSVLRPMTAPEDWAPFSQGMRFRYAMRDCVCVCVCV